MDLTEEEKEYIKKYEEKYGKLDEEGNTEGRRISSVCPADGE